jgi:hypothetical protein
MDIENVYWYQFSSGEYDSFGHDGTFYSTEYIDHQVWEDHLNEYTTEKKALFDAIPLKEVPGYRTEFPRKVLNFDTPEAKTFNEFLHNSDVRSTFIAKHGLIQLMIERDFHDSTS